MEGMTLISAPMVSVPTEDASPSPADTFEETQPRYLQVARALKSAIATGIYPVGSHLPTELQLCEQFKISRFTAREAVRMLSASGMVTRRQRIGTVVTASHEAARYAPPTSSVQDLWQYPQDTELRLVYVGKITLSKAQAVEFGIEEARQDWIYGMGLRMAGTVAEQAAGASRPISVTRLYLNPMLTGIETRLRGRRGAVHTLIAQEYGMAAVRVEQEIRGVLLEADDAANLNAPPGAAGLRIVRRYYNDKEELLEVTDNVHASDRFSYRMEMPI